MNDEAVWDRIRDHFDGPYHRGSLPTATCRASVSNPVCGDASTIELRVHDGVVGEAWFQAQGCLISLASASMLVEYVEGQHAETLRGMDEKQMLRLFGAPLSPRRVQCCLLPWRALLKALAE